MYKATTIAGEVVKKTKSMKKAVDNLKLQKLLYYIQAESLKLYDVPIFEDDIYAYLYGPVVKNVYEKYRRNVGMPIYTIEDEEDIEEIDDKTRQIINKIIERYINYSSFDLVDKTTEERPWKSTRQKEIISKEVIKEYFKEIERKQL